jgi:hypothetical protein
MNSRRNFLKSSAGLAATWAAGPRAGASAPPAAALPTVRLGDMEISRLVIGQNPFYGGSHFTPILDRLMAEWFTPEQVCQTLLECQQNGIKTYQFTSHVEKVPATGRSIADLELFRSRGGKMNLIVLDYAGAPAEESLELLRRVGGRAIYHHGERTDVLFSSGQMDQVQEYTKKMRQAGVLVGIGTHKPEVVEYAEERGWDVDFYMLSAYNRTRSPEELRKLLGGLPVPANEFYLSTDPPHAYQVARQTSKTCFLFKILAAGRSARSPEQVDAAFTEALTSIKPQDCIVVGMFPRFQNQVRENCDRVRKILNANG